jgi:hypothetical protein
MDEVTRRITLQSGKHATKPYNERRSIAYPCSEHSACNSEARLSTTWVSNLADWFAVSVAFFGGAYPVAAAVAAVAATVTAEEPGGIDQPSSPAATIPAFFFLNVTARSEADAGSQHAPIVASGGQRVHPDVCADTGDMCRRSLVERRGPLERTQPIG